MTETEGIFECILESTDVENCGGYLLLCHSAFGNDSKCTYLLLLFFAV